MSVAEVLSRAQLGMSAPLVHVEVHLAPGLPGFCLVGLPAPVVRESRERVRAAIQNSGYEFPPGRITVNLAPVELSKEGGRFDLPIALGLLLASGQARVRDEIGFECYGELGLSGELKAVGGLFLAAVHAINANHALLLPTANLTEARAAGSRTAVGFERLREVCEFLDSGLMGDAATGYEAAPVRSIDSPKIQNDPFQDIKGQWSAKRALVVAAAGGHSALMIGTPGSGKTMLATRLPGLLPPLSRDESLEVASIGSIASGQFDASKWGERPFRAPHHSASASAIVGGGPRLAPGEISLAHRGVLFLDELPEFDRRVLESLREPLENGGITLARASGRLELPAEFQLLAAMNPCPCGYLGDQQHECRCSPRAIERYRGRISGPLLDRIDIRIEVPRPTLEELRSVAGSPMQETGAQPDSEGAGLQQQIAAARDRQLQRAGCINARLPTRRLAADCRLEPGAARLLDRGKEQLALSGRGLHRLLRLGRTVADLADRENISAEHLAEAIQLRRPL